MKNSVFAIALTSAIAAASASVADVSYFSGNPSYDGGSVLELGAIRADADGFVEVYKLSGGELGQLVGTSPVHAGANADTTINLNRNIDRDLVAVVRTNGVITAEQILRMN